jgi:DtxR family Mn-dependent transcriptional regulator
MDRKRTISTEDYVKAIYKLQKEDGRVTTSALAEHLRLTDASATDMIKKLSSKGLVHYARYQGVALSARGRRMAMNIVRRHRLWEMYLLTFLGFSWDKVHDEADRLEHVTSDALEKQLDRALGSPKLDPHGDPIPTVDGRLDSTVHASLDEFNSGDRVRVLRVSDANPAILQHASRLGLRLNGHVYVKEKLAFDGSMRIKVGRKEQYISKQIANAIFVKPID